MPTEIVLLGCPLVKTLGGPSLLAGAVEALSANIPDARFTYVAHCNSQAEHDLAREHGVTLLPGESISFSRKMVPCAIVKRITGKTIGPPALRALIDAFTKAEVIVDTWGIAFVDSLGSNSFGARMYEGFYYALAKLLGKPIVKYTGDLGPFKQRWNRFFSKLYLGRIAELILARDTQTEQRLRELGVKKPVAVCPDSGFLMKSRESAQSQRLAQMRENRPVVMLSVSFQMRNRFPAPDDYMRLMAGLCRQLIEMTGGHVVVLPNQHLNEQNDDVQIAREVASLADSPACEAIDAVNMPAREVKGMIGQCDLMIAARYHSVVAALSLGVPTFALGWHHKYEGVMQFVGQERWVYDVRQLSSGGTRLDSAGLMSSISELWANRRQVREQILEKLPGVIEKVYDGGRQVSLLLQSRRNMRRS